MVALRYCSEKRKSKKVDPGIYLFFGKYLKNPSVNIWVLKMRFPKCTFFGPQLNRKGLVWYLLIRQKLKLSAGGHAGGQAGGLAGLIIMRIYIFK